eukprot:2521825-Amphidinium_carterae.1
MPTFRHLVPTLGRFAPTLEQPMPTCVVIVGVVVLLLVVAPVGVAAPLVAVILTKRTTSKT